MALVNRPAFVRFRYLFSTIAEARTFENQVLSYPDRFLPQCVVDSREWGVPPTPEYYEFMIRQYDASREASVLGIEKALKEMGLV